MTTRASVGSAGQQAEGESIAPSLSADGGRLAFVSMAPNLVAGDTNEMADVFVKDLLAGTLTRASSTATGLAGNGESFAPSISGDGMLVAFVSEATNLVPSDTNGVQDVFVRNLAAASTTRVSVGPGGIQANGPSQHASLSSEGRYLAFASHASNLVAGDSNKACDVFVVDLQTSGVERASVGNEGQQPNGACESPSISADGRYVAFASTATNLVPGAVPRRVWHVYVRDRQIGTTVRVSVSSAGAEGDRHSFAPAISADGRFVAFTSEAANLVPGDTNGARDVYVRDLQSGSTAQVSVGSGGIQGNGASSNPSISGNGRFVAFYSHASNLVPGDTNEAQDVFLHDRQAGTTTRLSVGALGGQGSGVSLWPSISRDGRFVAFPDAAGDLVPGDTNDATDVFVRGPLD